MSVRFLLADDHDVMRMGLRTLLSLKEDWAVCGEAADGSTTSAQELLSTIERVMSSQPTTQQGVPYDESFVSGR
jgi:DNA-binding NarL/FixJ family response regulator